MTYLYLLLHQVRLVLRTFVWRRHWAITVLLVLLGLYMVFSLVSLGFLWSELVGLVEPQADPVVLLNRHLVTIFLALFTLRFFVQRTPRMRIRPYLHLPVSRKRLVRFFQVSSLATVHNVFPLLFIVPLWGRHIYGGPYTPAAAWGWLAGVALVLVLSHYLNTLLRSLVRRSREGVFVAFGLLMLVLAVDLVLGPGVLNAVSAFVFDTLVAERPSILVLLAGLVGVVFTSSSLLLRDVLTRPKEGAQGRLVVWQVPFRLPQHRLANLVLLELKLMWRSERPKFYFLMSVVFATVYVAVPLLDTQVPGGVFMEAFVGLFASGIFVFNYGLLMFSWESHYFDGILARRIALRDMILAKMLLLQASCVGFYLISLPVIGTLAPGLLGLHAASLLYNAGVSTLLVMLLAVHNRNSVQLANVGFFNFEGFSLVHWLWLIPTVIPPALLLYAFEGVAPVAGMRVGTLAIAGVGLVGLLLTSRAAAFFTRRLQRQRYAMAAGFRETR